MHHTFPRLGEHWLFLNTNTHRVSEVSFVLFFLSKTLFKLNSFSVSQEAWQYFWWKEWAPGTTRLGFGSWLCSLVSVRFRWAALCLWASKAQGVVGAEQCQVPGLEELRGTRSMIALLEHSQKQILSSPSFKVIDCWRVMKNLMKSHLRKL